MTIPLPEKKSRDRERKLVRAVSERVTKTLTPKLISLVTDSIIAARREGQQLHTDKEAKPLAEQEVNHRTEKEAGLPTEKEAKLKEEQETNSNAQASPAASVPPRSRDPHFSYSVAPPFALSEDELATKRPFVIHQSHHRPLQSSTQVYDAMGQLHRNGEMTSVFRSDYTVPQTNLDHPDVKYRKHKERQAKLRELAARHSHCPETTSRADFKNYFHMQNIGPIRYVCNGNRIDTATEAGQTVSWPLPRQNDNRFKQFSARQSLPPPLKAKDTQTESVPECPHQELPPEEIIRKGHRCPNRQVFSVEEECCPHRPQCRRLYIVQESNCRQGLAPIRKASKRP